jgi:hypothetical protein
MYFQALHWIFGLSASIISVGYNRNVAIFVLFDHNFVELGLTICEMKKWLNMNSKPDKDYEKCGGIVFL